MIEIVRADTLRGFRALVDELGGDADALLAAARLDDGVDRDAYVSFRAVVRLLESAAAALSCPDFGLRLGAMRRDDALGPLAVVMQNAETARGAIGYAERFLHFHNLTLEARLVGADEPGSEFLSLEHCLARPMKMLQSSERMICFAARFIGMISGAPPQEVWFRHARHAPAAAYRAAFGAPAVRFAMPRQGLLVSREALEQPRDRADAQLRQIAEHFLESTAPVLEQGVSARARALIDRMMRIGECTQADLARALALHERTLQRRLQGEGTSFEAIKDEVRRDMARELLSQPNVSLSRVAEMLGYAETSALTRSSHRWFGMSPRDMRKALREEAA
ncbi:MAG TPA: AraC family transcriptional regulator ligand-binding domain-containing protein [Caulobacterales bacterium]|nr:AraC family transcriptional regulator ligand-binding domain-containing protein [Caulobacterales bacterium]